MNTEKLNKANNLKDQIEELKGHLAYVAEMPIKEIKRVVLETSNSRVTNRPLRPNHLPISVDHMLMLYIKSVQAEIEKLEIEFENL